MEIQLGRRNGPADSVTLPAVIDADGKIAPDVVFAEERRGDRPAAPRAYAHT